MYIHLLFSNRPVESHKGASVTIGPYDKQHSTFEIAWTHLDEQQTARLQTQVEHMPQRADASLECMFLILCRLAIVPGLEGVGWLGVNG